MARKLKWKVANIEEVDEKDRDLYEKARDDDGAESFIIPDMVPKARLDEFRSNNREMFKKTGELESKLKEYDGVDVAEYKSLKERIKKLDAMEDADLLKEGKIDEVVKKRTDAMRESYEAEKRALQKARDDAMAAGLKHREKLKKHELEKELLSHVNRVGTPRKGAQGDIINRALSVYDLDDNGNLMPNAGGKTVYGKKGEPIKPDEWAEQLLEEAPHLFEASKGGGAGGGNPDVKPGLDEKVLKDPDALTFSRNAKDIASGKIKVIRTR